MAFDLESCILALSPQGEFQICENRIPYNGQALIAHGELAAALRRSMDSRSRQEFDSMGRTRFVYSTSNGQDFHVDLCRSSEGHLATIRPAYSKGLPALDYWKSPPVIKNLSNLEQGLVLFVNPPGLGHAGLAESFVATCAATRNLCIRNFDPQGDLPAQINGSQIIAQNDSALDQAQGIDMAIRAGTNAFYFGEIHTLQLPIVLKAVSCGALVVASLGGMSASSVIERLDMSILSIGDQRSLSLYRRHLKAVICMHRIPSLRDEGLISAWDIILGNPTLGALLSAGEYNKIIPWQKSAVQEGMVHLDESLSTLVSQGRIDKTEALSRIAHRGIRS